MSTMSGSYDPFLVTLSFIVAVVASFTALGLARKVLETSGHTSTFWLVTGATSMGIGIWTMHFVGLLAFNMGAPFTYDVTTTALSLAIGVSASAFAIYVGSLAYVSNLKIAVSGLVLGMGIAGMHYSGMAAIHMEATIHYDPLLVAASIAIAIIAATAAIWIAFTLSRAAAAGLFKIKAMAAVVMGIAICGMHYTGMQAATFEPFNGAVLGHSAPGENTWLAVSIAIAALMILGVTHLTIFFDYRLAAERRIGEKAEQEAVQLGEILDESSNEIYVFATDTLRFLKVNKGAMRNLGYSSETLMGMTPVDLKPELTMDVFAAKLQALRDGRKQALVFDTVHRRADGSTYPVNVTMQLSSASTQPVFVATIADITERKNLEEQVMQSKKLEAIGQLAAGIAHEINTPTQFVGDNVRFLDDAFSDLLALVALLRNLDTAVRNESVTTELLDEVATTIEQADPDYLVEEIPAAMQQSKEGIERISKIVLAMKEFSHPGGADKELVDLNKNIANTIVVASNEWKYVADLTTDLDQSLPPVPCHPQELSQVMLNLIVNAAHAIAGEDEKTSVKKGEINITTRAIGRDVEIRVADTGSGIPEDIKDRVFDPFFTTKPVGKGTGQGLSMAYTTIVGKHGGRLEVDSEVGCGTTFVVSLPMAVPDEERQVAVA